MSCLLVDGNALPRDVVKTIAQRAAALYLRRITPCLAVVVFRHSRNADIALLPTTAGTVHIDAAHILPMPEADSDDAIDQTILRWASAMHNSPDGHSCVLVRLNTHRIPRSKASRCEIVLYSRATLVVNT